MSASDLDFVTAKHESRRITPHWNLMSPISRFRERLSNRALFGRCRAIFCRFEKLIRVEPGKQNDFINVFETPEILEDTRKKDCALCLAFMAALSSYSEARGVIHQCKARSRDTISNDGTPALDDCRTLVSMESAENNVHKSIRVKLEHGGPSSTENVVFGYLVLANAAGIWAFT
jgi:hypothetical protein